MISRNIDNIDWRFLSQNTSEWAADLLLQKSEDCATTGLILDNQKKIDWVRMFKNTNDRVVDFCIDLPHSLTLNTLMHKDFDELLFKYQFEFWGGLSCNRNEKAVDLLLQQRPDKIEWMELSFNPNEKAVDLLLQRPDKIHWKGLSLNPNEKAVDLLLQRPDKIHWKELSRNNNEKAVDFLLDDHPDKIDWSSFTINTNEKAVDFLLDDHPDKIDWMWASLNSHDRMVDLLESEGDGSPLIDWGHLSANKNERLWNSGEYVMK